MHAQVLVIVSIHSMHQLKWMKHWKRDLNRNSTLEFVTTATTSTHLGVILVLQ